ncbi:MAG: DUF1428 domain-containing protein [archaeon]|nr:DUF1428 domain-containing protein [archaeon]
MAYVDGFVIPIPKKNLKAYEKMAKMGGKTWLKHGALQYLECVGDDMNVVANPAEPKNKVNVFAKKFSLKPTETIMFSWIMFKSKAHRDSVNKKVMKEMNETMKDFDMKDMPFDMKKVLYAGFKPLVKMEK